MIIVSQMIFFLATDLIIDLLTASRCIATAIFLMLDLGFIGTSYIAPVGFLIKAIDFYF